MKRRSRLSMMILQHDLRLPVNLAAKAVLGIVGREDDARPAGAQAGLDLGGGIADGRDDPQPGDDDTTHGRSLPFRGPFSFQLSDSATFMSLTW
jgi:hypothetical protein